MEPLEIQQILGLSALMLVCSEISALGLLICQVVILSTSVSSTWWTAVCQ
jgi:hypothetical protein